MHDRAEAACLGEGVREVQTPGQPRIVQRGMAAPVDAGAGSRVARGGEQRGLGPVDLGWSGWRWWLLAGDARGTGSDAAARVLRLEMEVTGCGHADQEQLVVPDAPHVGQQVAVGARCVQLGPLQTGLAPAQPAVALLDRQPASAGAAVIDRPAAGEIPALAAQPVVEPASPSQAPPYSWPGDGPAHPVDTSRRLQSPGSGRRQGPAVAAPGDHRQRCSPAACGDRCAHRRPGRGTLSGSGMSSSPTWQLSTAQMTSRSSSLMAPAGRTTGRTSCPPRSPGRARRAAAAAPTPSRCRGWRRPAAGSTSDQSFQPRRRRAAARPSTRLRCGCGARGRTSWWWRSTSGRASPGSRPGRRRRVQLGAQKCRSTCGVSLSSTPAGALGGVGQAGPQRVVTDPAAEPSGAYAPMGTAVRRAGCGRHRTGPTRPR